MSFNNITESLARAEQRFGSMPARTPTRRGRSDRGRLRMAPAVARRLAARLDGYARPRVADVLAAMRRDCRARGERCPSRAAIYTFMARAPVRSYRVEHLPPGVRETLFNLSADADVPGDQLAFHCLNYGGTAAMSFAAGLPWRHLHLAARKRGWRPKSRGLVDAILRVRRR